MIFENWRPRNLLDVGCGPGIWLLAARELGIAELFGIDGTMAAVEAGRIPSESFRQVDLSKSWQLGTKFDAILCLEVGEHLPEESAVTLIESLTQHSDRIFFSAACPGQIGQHHVNCQWPAYWQGLFNRRGYRCRDEVRWRIWGTPRIEPWYRQNLFLAERDEAVAGREPRLASVIHPECLPFLSTPWQRLVESGGLSAVEYARLAVRGLAAKVRRRLGRPAA